MLLSLENIGMVSRASVAINGIAVIAGENNTGKSTVSKALYSLFSALHDNESKIFNNRKESIINEIYRPVRLSSYDFADSDLEHVSYHDVCSFVEELLNDKYIPESVEKKISDFYGSQLCETINNELTSGVDGIVKRVIQIIAISDDDAFRTLLGRNLDQEFNSQINSIYSEDPGTIKLTIKSQEISVSIINNEVKQVSNRPILDSRVFYIDDPLVIDDSCMPLSFRLRGLRSSNHREQLAEALYKVGRKTRTQSLFDEIVIKEKLDAVIKKLDLVCDGSIEHVSGRRLGYKDSSMSEPLDVRSLSTGLKAFVVLKSLLLSGELVENGTIILDEPEIHLHPEWQLLFAEVIVLLHAHFGIHILINTHSPYFLNALEVYSARHHVADKCTYYLAEESPDPHNGHLSVINDVTDNTELIYRKLALPLQRLEDEAASL